MLYAPNLTEQTYWTNNKNIDKTAQVSEHFTTPWFLERATCGAFFRLPQRRMILMFPLKLVNSSEWKAHHVELAICIMPLVLGRIYSVSIPQFSGSFLTLWSISQRPSGRLHCYLTTILLPSAAWFQLLYGSTLALQVFRKLGTDPIAANFHIIYMWKGSHLNRFWQGIVFESIV